MSNSQFIGKGKESNGRIRMSIKMAEAETFITEFEGEKYLHFTVSPLKSRGNYGHTHTIVGYHREEKKAAE